MSTYQPGLSIKEAVGEGKEIHKLSSNENPIGPSPKAVQVMQEHMTGLNFYPERTDASLKEALVKYIQKVFGYELEPTNFISTNSGSEVIALLSQAFLTNTSNIVICPPAFPVYEVAAAKMGATVIEAPLNTENFAFEAETIKNAITPDTGIVYLCNPNNPTGTYFDAATLDSILEVIPDNVIVAYDEVYHHFVSCEKPDAIAKVLEGKNIVIIHSFSKAFGLAGMRVGYGIAKPEIIAKMEAMKFAFHLSTLKMVAAEAALADEAHVTQTVENNAIGRKLIFDTLTDLGIKVWPSEANFLVFECPKDHSPEELSTYLLENSIMVRPAFGLSNHLRISVGIPEANQLFLEAMKTIVS